MCLLDLVFWPVALQHHPALTMPRQVSAHVWLQGEIYVTVQYKPISQDPLWNSGVLGSSRGKEDPVPDGAVPHVYFPLRKGCRVTMYNDAHQVSTVLLSSNTSAADAVRLCAT